MGFELDFFSSRLKRRRVFTEKNDNSGFNYSARSTGEANYRRMMGLPSVMDYPDSFSMDLMKEIDKDRRYGSVTKEMLDLWAGNRQLLSLLRERYPSRFPSPVPSRRSSEDAFSLKTQDVISLDDDDDGEASVPVVEASNLILHTKPVEVIDLDEEDGEQVGRPDNSYDLQVSKMKEDPGYGSQVAIFGLELRPQAQSLYHEDQERRDQGNTLLESYRGTSYGFQENPVGEISIKDSRSDSQRSKAKKEEDNTLGGETVSAKSKGVLCWCTG